MSNANVSMLTLVDGCCRNDRSSQRELYRCLYGYVMKICYRYTNHQYEADELTNESFVKLFKKMQLLDAGSYLNTETLFKAWFKPIIIGTCIDYIRRHHSMINGHTNGTDSGLIADDQEIGIDKLSYEEIIEAIRQLTPVCRTVYNLFVIEGMTHEKIAAHLRISVGSSKSNLSKARHTLRKIISHQSPAILMRKPDDKDNGR